MQKPLVVVIPSADRDALRKAGVLPPAWFRDVGPAGWDDEGTCIRLWTEEPVYGLTTGESGAPPLPARLLGLPNDDARPFALDRLVAKFFGTVMLHVVFLDEREKGAEDDRSRRSAPPGDWVGVRPLLETIQWAKMFNRSIEYWFSEEQVRDIRHLVLVVARGGRNDMSAVRVRLDEDQSRSLQAEFSPQGTVQTCYFIDGLLESEHGRQALHGACLWPVLAGRLVLRLLIALSADHADDVFSPGVHLWRSFEYLFDYPVGEMKDMLTSALAEAYDKLSKETDSSSSSGKPSISIDNKVMESFPDLTTALTQFQPIPAPPGIRKRRSFLASVLAFGRKKGNSQASQDGVEWQAYPATDEADTCAGDDETRWGGSIKLAKAEFAGMETELFRKGDPALANFSPCDAFTAVKEKPRNVAAWLKAVNSARPTDTIDGSAIFMQWNKIVEAEENRKKAKKRLLDGAGELSRAQAHYVTAPYAAIVVGAVSLVCGITLCSVFWTLGGIAAMPVAFFFSGLAVAGAFMAWGVVSWCHCRAGCEAVEQFVGIAREVDHCMDLRHESAVETVRLAETQHRTLLRVGAWHALHRLLNRVWRILSVELQTPSLAAFYRTEDDVAKEGGDMPDETASGDEESLRQRAVFFEKTRCSEKLRKGEFASVRHRFSDGIISEALDPTQNGPNSFRKLWSVLCRELDGQARGNLPAKILIPAIRHWLGALCDRLIAAQKADLLASRDTRDVLPAGFSALRSDSDYALATAHVNRPEMSAWPFRVFVYDEPRDGGGVQPGRGVAARARQILAGGVRVNIPVTATPILNGLPQIAFGFQDIRLFGLGCEKDGRLKFLRRHEVGGAASGREGA